MERRKGNSIDIIKGERVGREKENIMKREEGNNLYR